MDTKLGRVINVIVESNDAGIVPVAIELLAQLPEIVYTLDCVRAAGESARMRTKTCHKQEKSDGENRSTFHWRYFLCRTVLTDGKLSAYHPYSMEIISI